MEIYKMKIEDVKLSWLVKMAKKFLKKSSGEAFAYNVLNKQRNQNQLWEESIHAYAFLCSEEGKSKEELFLNTGDQSLFLYLLIALSIQKSGQKLKNLESCRMSLSECLLNYSLLDKNTQKRMADCLLDAAQALETTN